jgi:hypothetical protein
MTEQPAGPHCGNNPNAQLTPADRQAVDDFKARLALRERIADTLAATDGWRWVSDSDKARSSTYRGYQTRADAVLAVLPAPADRAAELEEAATALDAQSCTCGCRRGAEFLRQRAAVIRASDGPSRMADEAQQPETQLPYIHVDDDGDQLDIGAVMASTYDGEAPVVYVAADQHQGDQVATVYVRPERVDEVIAALRSARQQAETLPAVGAQQPETQAEDPARIDRLRPEFFEHASVESIDVQIRRAQRQQRQWGNRLQTLAILRQARVMQKELGEWPAVVSQPGKEA